LRRGHPRSGGTTFADNQAFCDFTEPQFVEAACKDLHESFNGRRAPLLSASRVAVEAGAATSQMVGAALVSKDKGYGPVLDLILVSPRWQRRDLASALVSDAMNEIYRSGEQTITSCYQLANTASQSWHRAFGFIEMPDLRFAYAYHRRAAQELHRREKIGVLTDEERAALQAEVAYCRNRIDELERLADNGRAILKSSHQPAALAQ
jgi:GNAT superfamily N-acetyltransferase